MESKDFEVYKVFNMEELESSKKSWSMMADVDFRLYGSISEKVLKHLYHINKAMEELKNE